jgi:mono/diheme cytochrome c family protein
MGFPQAAISAENSVPHQPGIELPAGTGKDLLLAACVRCHDLRGLPAYRGYWNHERWRSMIDTMVKHGAPLNTQQADELAAYLALHFGRADQ